MAILSFGKKNAKTSLAAFLLLLHLCGPEAIPNTQLPSTAQSKEQAAVLFNLAAKVVRLSPTLSPFLVVRDTIKEIFCPGMGTKYKALSAEASTAHGQSPIFAVHDELGQVKGPVSELFNAIENAMGAHDNPMSIVISTQAPTDNDLLSILIDDAKAGKDPRVVLSLYTADLDLDPFSEKAIRQANPAFGDFLNAKEVLDQADKARRMPSQEPLYRNYTLNQRVEVNSPFVTKAVWNANAAIAGDFGDLPVYGGLDLSEVNDLTCLVLGAKRDDIWHVKPTFWLPEQGLPERSRGDRVPYDLWARWGVLETVPGKSVDYKFVAERLWRLRQNVNLQKIGFDRWNWRHFRPWLIAAGFSEEQTNPGEPGSLFVEVGQGFQTMSPALRDMESVLLNGKMAHGIICPDCGGQKPASCGTCKGAGETGHPVLAMCAANAVVQSDPAGGKKLSKSRSRGRIDGMVALADMFAAAPTEVEAPLASPWDDPNFSITGD